VDITFNFDDFELEFMETDTQIVYSKKQSIPIVINNKNDYDIKGTVYYNDTALSEEITLKANEEYNIVSASVEEIYDFLTIGETYYLDFKTTSPAIGNNESVVSFKKEQAMIDIIKVESYVNDVLIADEVINYTENSLIVDNDLTSDKATIRYQITVKNNSETDVYKLRNITEIINSNSEANYVADIDLSDGILIKPQREFTFNISYNYDNNINDNSHRQILFFDFRWNYTFAAVEDKLITLSSPAVNSSKNYGDFGVIDKKEEMLSNFCVYDDCYSDNNGLLEYGSEGELILDSNNPIALLNIDQSMSVEDEYSIYMTIKGDTNQEGGALNFPGTIIAISESNQKYLSWIGFYKNYLHVYSYRTGSSLSKRDYDVTDQIGFTSINISQYSNKKINLQVVGIRGGSTKIYINGELLRTFDSGVDPVSYTFATIGDLRPGRNLKFTGVVYDVAVYNKALSAEEVQTNWEYAEETWGITG